MMPGAVASTAYGPMLYSAWEQMLPQPARIVDDPLAGRMLPAYAKPILQASRWKPLRRALLNAFEKSAPGIRGALLCRKRYIEDRLVDSLSAGFDSVVILGAGLDTLAYRLPQLAATPVYEVDLPENIAYKKKAVEALYGDVPAHVRLVPLDFETQTLETGLRAAGYADGETSFFVWEGVTQYLTETAVHETMQFLAQAGAGSRLVFTYILKTFIDGTDTDGLDSLYRRMRVNHAYWLFGLHPQDVGAFVGGYGWTLKEQMRADDYRRRYVMPAGRTVAVAEIEPAVYAEKVAG